MSSPNTDIRDKNDIRSFVDSFYGKVRKDALLFPVFAAVIPEPAWPAHLERMYDFWNAILFSETGFQGNPMQKHLRLPINEEHFRQWLVLFNQTIDEQFSGVKAEEAKTRALSIARILQFKIHSMRR